MTKEQKEWIKVNSHNYTAAQISAITGVEKKNVYNQLIKRNLPFIRVKTLSKRIGIIRKQAPYYTARELAEKFGVSYQGMRTFLHNNKIKPKSGRYWERKKKKQ